jgi:hypothetical protein
MFTKRTPEPKPGAAASARSTADVRGPVPPFDGYPYLVTRIGRTALRHIALVPADWPRERLVDLTRRQAEANRLETCLCLGSAEAVFVTPGREPFGTTIVPTGVPVVDRLVLADALPPGVELASRMKALATYADRWRGSGYLVGDGLEGGRLATAEDVHRLTAADDAALPPGLRPCRRCRQPFGEFLALKGEGNGDRRPRVVDVFCRCQNHNRCARCGGALGEHRLSAYSWHGSGICYVAAYSGLRHRCAT